MISLATAGCSTTSLVQGPDLVRALKSSPKKDRLVMRTPNGSRFRLDPRSQVRFHISDGSLTPWVRAADLRIADSAVVLPLGPSASKGAALELTRVQSAEVRNLSHGKTLAVTVGVTAIIAAVVAMALADSDDDNSVIRSRSSRRSRRGASRRRVTGRRRGWGAFGPVVALDVAPYYGYYGVDHHHHHHHHHHGAPVPAGRPPGAEARPTGHPGEAPSSKTIQPQPLAMRRVFSPQTQRRSKIQGFIALEGGTELQDADEMITNVTAGIRLANIFELGGGLRYLFHDGENSPSRHRLAGFGYLGGNFTLDAGGWVSVPLGIELGAGKDIAFHSRLKAGLRVNVLRDLSVGIYPFNPTYTQASNTRAELELEEWTFPTSLEVSFRF
jgi:hypothetical protein